MKQKVLAIAGCLAATAPSIGIANALPENFLGLNLGEIRSNSFLNQPFKGVIPFLFASHETTKSLTVQLAPQSIFEKVGADKHPILNELNFQVASQNNKPVILISSDKPINLPFLNFILEIKGLGSTVYQDYTVLLDPETKDQNINSNITYIDVEENNEKSLYETYKDVIKKDNEIVNNKTTNERSLEESGTLLLASLSSEIITAKSNKLEYKVKGGDSLSKIAQKYKVKDASLKVVSKLIYQKNPTAFIDGNVNKIKKGAVLNLPTEAEVHGFDVAKIKPNDTKNQIQSAKPKTVTKAEDIKAPVAYTKTTPVKTESAENTPTTYKVVKGDSLSKITRKFVTQDISISELMDSIYNNNPTAFINSNKNKLKLGASLEIPTFKPTEQQAQPTTVVATIVEKVDTKSQETAVEKDTNVSMKPNQYLVKEGETLSSITKEFLYEDVPFATMLKGIYDYNPDAFKRGKMTSLITGSIITLPPKDTLELPKNTNISVAQTTPNKIPQRKLLNSDTYKAENKVEATGLTKRIRELRNELRQAKDSLSELKNNLKDKELVIEQKDFQLKSLNTMLTTYDKMVNAETLKAVALRTKVTKSIIEDRQETKSKAEIAKLKRDLFYRTDKTSEQLAKVKVLKDKALDQLSINDNNNVSLLDSIEISALLTESNKKHAYLLMTLLLGLLLIRYRRSLYSYTYSKISLEEPKYYPVPDADKYDLTEKNLNFHDPKMDEQSERYESLNTEPAESADEEQELIEISPHLVEAEAEMFDLSEEELQIKHCEHLVTELFEDLDERDEDQTNAEWEDIEKLCDTYIEKLKDEETLTNSVKNTAVVEEAADFNIMMTDLLESLEKVDRSVKRNNILDEDFPDIVKDRPNSTDHHPLI